MTRVAMGTKTVTQVSTVTQVLTGHSQASAQLSEANTKLVHQILSVKTISFVGTLQSLTRLQATNNASHCIKEKTTHRLAGSL